MAIDRDAVHPGDQITYLAPPHVPGQGELAGEVEYAVSDGVWVIQGGYRYRIGWHRITRHWPRSNPPAAGSCPGSGQSWATGDQPPHGGAPAVCPGCRLTAAELGATAVRMVVAARWRGTVPEHPTCGHRRGAIDLDSGAWHCYQCGGRVIEEDPAPAASPEARQRARVDELMNQPSDQWPPALLTFINHEWTGPRRGDALAAAVTAWVRGEAS